MKKVLVLGAGMIGGAIAEKLSNSFEVTVCDIDKYALSTLRGIDSKIHAVQLDFLSPEIMGYVLDTDYVVGAMPESISYQVLGSIVELGKPIVDISFFSEGTEELHELAKKYSVPIVLDFGFAPGMNNFLLGCEMRESKVEELICYCGGFPKAKDKLWSYRAPFEVRSILEICTRPALTKVAGKIVERPALSDCEFVEYDGIDDTFEAFTTDGLRSLLDLPVPNMVEKTVRHVGFVEKMKVLVDSGFLSKEKVDIGGRWERPYDVTAAVLTDAWKLYPGEKEYSAMKLLMNSDGKKVEYSLIDSGDEAQNVRSMARVTGYPAAAIVHLFAKNEITDSGVITPEQIGLDYSNRVRTFIPDYLLESGIKIMRKQTA